MTRADNSTRVQCIAKLPTEALLVTLRDEPGGKTLQAISTPNQDGVLVEVQRERDGWSKVRLESGIEGWVESDLVPLALLQ